MAQIIILLDVVRIALLDKYGSLGMRSVFKNRHMAVLFGECLKLPYGQWQSVKRVRMSLFKVPTEI